MQADTPLEIPVDADPGCAGVPPVSVYVLKRVAVSGSLYESTRLVCDGIVWRICEWPERIVTQVDAGGVDVVLRTRCAVLQVIASGMLRHPRAFHVWTDCVAMVLAKSFPAMAFGLETEQPLRRSLVGETVGLVELDDMKRIRVGRIPVQKPALRVAVVKELGIPWTGLHRVRLCERARFILARHGQPGQQTIVEFHTTLCRLREHENRKRARRAWQQVNSVPHCQHCRCNDIRDRPSRWGDMSPRAQVA